MNALKAAASQISHNSALNTSKPSTSVSFWVDRLCSDVYAEDELDGIAELVESVNSQVTGPTECARCIRKKLKYSNAKGQLRALTIFKIIVENSPTPIRYFDSALIDRIKILSHDPLTDPTVKRKLLSMLGGFSREFKEDRNLAEIVGLYASCKGGSGQSGQNSEARVYAERQERYDKETKLRNERKDQERNLKQQRKEREAAIKVREKESRTKKAAPTTGRRKFVFDVERPKIMMTIGESTQAANSLINAILNVDRSRMLLSESPAVGALEQAKASRKAVVRYIQLLGEHSTDSDNAGDIITSLLTCNEQILNALSLYDRLNKSIDLDSDEELPTVEEQHDDDDDTRSIRSKISAFDLMDTEFDKLNIRQRREIEREMLNRESAMDDLRELDFTRTLSDYSDRSDSEGQGDEGDPFGDSNAASTPTIEVERLDWRTV